MPEHLDIPLKGRLGPEGTCRCTRDAIELIMYLRGLFPCPTSELRQPGGATNKQAARALEALERVASAGESAMRLLAPARDNIRALISLGTSPFRPKEAIELRLGVTSNAESERESTIAEHAKKLGRALIPYLGGQQGTAPKKVWLLVEAPLTAQLPREFAPKMNSSPALHKARSHLIANLPGGEGEGSDPVVAEGEDVWWQCYHAAVAFSE